MSSLGLVSLLCTRDIRRAQSYDIVCEEKQTREASAQGKPEQSGGVERRVLELRSVGVRMSELAETSFSSVPNCPDTKSRRNESLGEEAALEEAVLEELSKIAELVGGATDAYESELMADGWESSEGFFRRRFLQENSIMAPLTKLWIDLFRLLHLQDCRDLEKRLREVGPSALDGWHELLEVEADWLHLLQRLDVKLNSHLLQAPERIIPGKPPVPQSQPHHGRFAEDIWLRKAGEGRRVQLSSLLKSRYTLVVFLRHSRSHSCRSHVREVGGQRELLREYGCGVVLVVGEASGDWSEWEREALWEDDVGELSDAVRLGRTVAGVARPARARAIAASLLGPEGSGEAASQGWIPLYQCGADVVLRPDGRVSFLSVVKQIGERCKMGTILDKVGGNQRRSELQVTRL